MKFPQTEPSLEKSCLCPCICFIDSTDLVLWLTYILHEEFFLRLGCKHVQTSPLPPSPTPLHMQRNQISGGNDLKCVCVCVCVCVGGGGGGGEEGGGGLQWNPS